MDISALPPLHLRRMRRKWMGRKIGMGHRKGSGRRSKWSERFWARRRSRNIRRGMKMRKNRQRTLPNKGLG